MGVVREEDLKLTLVYGRESGRSQMKLKSHCQKGGWKHHRTVVLVALGKEPRGLI